MTNQIEYGEKEKRELFELTATTTKFTFSIGNFQTKTKALEAVESDKNAASGTYSTDGQPVQYWFDEEMIG